MTFNEMLGIRVVEHHPDGLTVECLVRPEHLNGGGVVHGGLTATIADTAMGLAVYESFGGSRRTATVELKINYLLPIVQGRIVARSYILRRGKTLQVGRVDVSDGGGRLVAVALMTFIVMPVGETPVAESQTLE